MDVYFIPRLKNSEGKGIVKIVLQNYIKAFKASKVNVRKSRSYIALQSDI